MKKGKRIFFIITFILFSSIFMPITSRANEQIDLDTIEINYEYDSEKNTVIAKVTSTNQLNATKQSWKLSEDKLSYTYEFKENTTYTTTFEDIYGNKKDVNINITQIDKKGPVLNIKYAYNDERNTVNAIVTSNEKLLNTKKSWILSEDKLSYAYEFKENTTYTTEFEDLYGNKTSIQINITQIIIPKMELEILYEYNEITNTVIATIKSNEQLLNNKISWKLSDDKLSYTYEFYDNTKYTTTFEDIYGNKSNIDINIDQIDKEGPVLEIQYNYTIETNSVKVGITSNEELSDTKISWNLSEDKLSYTYEFYDNTSYTTTFEDIYGNKTSIIINVIQIDKIAPSISVEYILNNDNSITVKLNSNEELKNTKKGWKLDDSKKCYSYIFYEDANYQTIIEDLVGNTTVVKIKFQFKEYNYDGSPKINVKYLYTSNEYVLVKINSSIKMQDTKPTWTLSADGYSYEKIFNSNNIYKTGIIDINGKETIVDIIVNFFESKDRYNGIDVSSHQGIIDWKKVKESGIDYAIIRAGFRGYGSAGSLNVDSYFERNLKNATFYGVDVGVYFFSQAISVDEAIEEANLVLNLIKKYNIKIQYPIAIDTEKTPIGNGRADSISKTTRTDICIAFCKTIEAAGYKSMIYANKYWLLNDLELDRLQNYDIWLAHYVNETDYKYSYTMWQYTSIGSVNGIGGNVDKNYCYKKY